MADEDRLFVRRLEALKARHEKMMREAWLDVLLEEFTPDELARYNGRIGLEAVRGLVARGVIEFYRRSDDRATMDVLDYLCSRRTLVTPR